MQNLSAETDEWLAKARAAGPGWRAWRWEEYLENPPFLVWRYRLLAPGEEPDAEELGIIL